MPTDFDDNGWLIGDLAPLAVNDSYTLLSPDAPSLLNGERIRHQAKRFFQIDLELTSPKHYPGGGWPRFDRAAFTLTRTDTQRVIEVSTFPLEHAPAVRRVATDTAARVGAGLDVLVARTRRVWQFPGAYDDPFPLALAAVLASVFLAPVLPPGGATVFGVKTAREHLAALGWRT